MKQKWVLIAALVVGALAFWLTNRYLQAERAKLFDDAEQIRVVVAGRDLAAGTVLSIDHLAVKSVFRTAVGGQAVLPGDVDAVLGKRLRYSMSREDPLLWSFVDLPERMRAGLSPMIQPGLRAVSLSLSGDAAVSGLVQPNDRVDLLGTFTIPSRREPGQMETVTLTVLQDVTVLATGRDLARHEPGMGPAYEGRPGGYSTVTFEVTPREAELLIFAQHMRGQLALSLRNPEDMSFEHDLPEVNFQHLETVLEELNLYRQRHIRHKRDL